MIWSNDRIKLFNADCFDIFPKIADKSVDLILADLPYGTTQCKWDSILPFDKLWKEYERIIKDNGAIVLSASQPFTSALIMSNPSLFRYNWIYKKTKATGFLDAKKRPLNDYEDICVFYKKPPIYNPQMIQAEKQYKRGLVKKRKSDCYGEEYAFNQLETGMRYPKRIIEVQNANTQNIFHPTQKPVFLMEYFVKTYTNESDLVLDNTFGSGTTAVACQNLNRQFVGMEKEKKYFDIAVQRLTA
jgi:site-specific DNA-methyltransferase (adenine-specific)